MYDIKDKEKNMELMNKIMLNKSLSMFEYSNLPDSLPAKVLERYLQTLGFVFITEIDGVLYPLTGSLGGELDEYQEFTKITVTNTALKISKEFDIKNDGVLISNDDLKIGLMPIYNKLNYMLVENDINMILWGYNTRQQKLISASDDKTKASAESYLKKLIDGDLSVIGDKPFLESLNVHNSNSSGGTKVNEFLELHQYLKSNLFNEIGLSSNFNMKKERLISSELDLGEDSLFPLVYTMMKNRIDGIESLNSRYGLEIDLDFGSVWALKNKKLVDGVVENEQESDKLEAVDSDSDRTVDFDIQTEEVDNSDHERERERGESSEPEPESDLEPEETEDPEVEETEESEEEKKDGENE